MCAGHRRARSQQLSRPSWTDAHRGARLAWSRRRPGCPASWAAAHIGGRQASGAAARQSATLATSCSTLRRLWRPRQRAAAGRPQQAGVRCPADGASPRAGDQLAGPPAAGTLRRQARTTCLCDNQASGLLAPEPSRPAAAPGPASGQWWPLRPDLGAAHGVRGPPVKGAARAMALLMLTLSTCGGERACCRRPRAACPMRCVCGGLSAGALLPACLAG